MSSHQHTPGPWEYQPVGGAYMCFDVLCDGYFVATTHDGVKSQHSSEANARLISAAPDLYELVSRLANPDDGELLTLDDYRQIARSVIAKATGV